MDIAGKTGLIAGGASGLGEAAARRLHQEGAYVVVFDLNKERGQLLTEELGAERFLFVAGSVTEEADAQRAVDAAVETFDGLHVAVNTAGIATPGRILGQHGPLALESFARVIAVNLIGTFNVMRLAAAAMQRNEPLADGERGVIINTASIAAYEGQIGQAAYAASKGGVAGLTLPAARDLAKWGIRVVTIAPGLFDTPLLAGLPETVRVDLGRQIPFPSRLGRPPEYALLVAHIIENVMLNGEIIRLDGALRMGPR
jgi:NAD(P)-dependent dehydrogenase (short-subunit alcohol dehydrogenase family)